MVTGTGLAASEARARHWLAMMAFAAIGAALADGVSEDRVSAALVGGAAGAIPVSVGGLGLGWGGGCGWSPFWYWPSYWYSPWWNWNGYYGVPYADAYPY